MERKQEEYTRVFDARLACIDEIGLKGAIILHQLQYWLDITRQQAASNEEIRAKHFISGKWWIYNTYEQWQQQFSFWSMSTIKREFNRLEKAGILIAGRYNLKGYDQTKWYTISKKRLETLINTHSVKMTQWKVSKWHDAECQNEPTNTKEYPKNTNKEYIEGKRDFFGEDEKITPAAPAANNEPINYQMLRFQVKRACDTSGYDANYCYKVIEYFFKRYKEITGANHPKLKQTNIEKVIDKIMDFASEADIDIEQWQQLTDKYLNTKFDCDYRINHFLSEGILQNRFYEELY